MTEHLRKVYPSGVREPEEEEPPPHY
jgi:uncharacterized coiled-coil protein SlyX